MDISTDAGHHTTTDDTLATSDHRALGGIVLAVALLTCLFIIALPLLGSLVLAAAVLAVFAGCGLAAIFALARL